MTVSIVCNARYLNNASRSRCAYKFTVLTIHARREILHACVITVGQHLYVVVCDGRLAALLRITYLAPFTVTERCVVRTIDSSYIGPMGDEPLETQMRVWAIGIVLNVRN